MTNYSDKIIITTGDPNGIGAEITIKALKSFADCMDKIAVISNKKILDYYGGLGVDVELIEVPYSGEVQPGKVSANSGEFSFKTLKKVCELRPKAIVTAPVAKNAMHIAGHNYNGQTEVLQEFLAKEGQLAEMLFVAKDFRVLLLTRHCALKDIDLTTDLIEQKILNLQTFFQEKLNISSPKFALCGLNPHAGEDGILGDEEISVINPAIEKLRDKGISITNPLPSDTLFVGASEAYRSGKKVPYDCYIATYHDQGLIPIKCTAGYSTVNMTIGLDVIRTSPGHGTAFDIAGKNIASENGMISAIEAALQFV